MPTSGDRWFDWQVRQRFAYFPEDERVARARSLQQVRDRVLQYAHIAPGSRVLDVGCGTGLLAFGAVRPNPLTDSPFQRLACEVGESLAQAYMAYMGELVARFGRRQRVPMAWVYGVRAAPTPLQGIHGSPYYR